MWNLYGRVNCLVQWQSGCFRFVGGRFKTCKYSLTADIVTRDMVWKLGELQSVYNELQFNVGTASPCTNLLKFC